MHEKGPYGHVYFYFCFLAFALGFGEADRSGLTTSALSAPLLLVTLLTALLVVTLIPLLPSTLQAMDLLTPWPRSLSSAWKEMVGTWLMKGMWSWTRSRARCCLLAAGREAAAVTEASLSLPWLAAAEAAASDVPDSTSDSLRTM